MLTSRTTGKYLLILGLICIFTLTLSGTSIASRLYAAISDDLPDGMLYNHLRDDDTKGYAVAASQYPSSSQGSWIAMDDYQLVMLTGTDDPVVIDVNDYAGEVVVDNDFNSSLDSDDLRANYEGQDWYESRGDDPDLLVLDTSNVGGNGVLYRINTGGPEVSTGGATWSADQYYLKYYIPNPIWANFIDDFREDTTDDYDEERFWGTSSSFLWDDSGQRAQIVTGNNEGIRISHSTTPSDSGTFSMDFLPTVKHPENGWVLVRLIEDANNYWDVWKTTGGDEDFGIIKYEDGVQDEDVGIFLINYTQNQNYHISISFSPNSITADFGGEVLNITDINDIVVNKFEIEIGQQDAYIDNIIFSNTVAYETAIPIEGTTDDVLYQTERFGDSFSYSIPIDPGDYTVDLHFAEISGIGSAGERVFSVDIEDAQGNLTDYDIFADVGAATAVVKTFENITVTDGFLDIEFSASVDKAKISAIQVTSPSDSCMGDIDEDGDRDGYDLGLFIDAYDTSLGDPDYDPLADLDNDDDVDADDLNEFAGVFGTDCP